MISIATDFNRVQRTPFHRTLNFRRDILCILDALQLLSSFYLCLCIRRVSCHDLPEMASHCVTDVALTSVCLHFSSKYANISFSALAYVYITYVMTHSWSKKTLENEWYSSSLDVNCLLMTVETLNHTTMTLFSPLLKMPLRSLDLSLGIREDNTSRNLEIMLFSLVLVQVTAYFWRRS